MKIVRRSGGGGSVVVSERGRGIDCEIMRD